MALTRKPLIRLPKSARTAILVGLVGVALKRGQEALVDGLKALARLPGIFGLGLQAKRTRRRVKSAVESGDIAQIQSALKDVHRLVERAERREREGVAA